jgi:phosphoglycolate phosphatase
MIGAVMFDLDGTLVHSSPGVLASFRKTFDAEGVTAVQAIDESVIGPPLLTTLARLTAIDDADRLQQLAHTFKATYDTDGVLFADPYPGLAGVLEALTAAGREVFIVTNKRLSPARMIAERLGMMPRLAGVYALDSFTPPAARKRNVIQHLLAERGISASSAVMVGDSVDDADAAAANGVPFIAVTYGYGSPLGHDTPPAATLDRLADLPRILGSLD